jgi:hypothetical protein
MKALGTDRQTQHGAFSIDIFGGSNSTSVVNVCLPVLVQDVLKDAIENNIKSATEMPYFEGDFWPNVLEESIKELDEEEEEKRKREEAEAIAAEEAETIPEGTDMGSVVSGGHRHRLPGK